MEQYTEETATETSNDIAIIGMTGRFPQAANLNQFWENLKNGVESVQFFNHDDLKDMGIDEHLLDNPKFVAADAVLDDIDQFDARFFNIAPREAEITDPQQRLFLEACWEVMENAGYSPEKYEGVVGVYAGTALSGYMMRNLKSNRGLIERVGTFKTMLANDKDFLSTKVSYKMGFTGPSVNVNTLCSSSAVAIHLAVESLLNFQTDIAIAGGVSFQITRNEAFFYQEGNIGAPDGHCRAFDERAAGTVSGSGLGVLALKRLDEAQEDGDNILALIKGTAINNDGADKASYTAPSADGQASVITAAQEMAGIEPDSVTYIEAHGTGTNLGDPIEVSGLTKSFRRQTEESQFCALGSVKTNIGHLVTAGGVASVIKTVLALQHRQIPASLNFERPNPKIDFANSPFYVNTELSEWNSRNGEPLRAGVSSFGIGGTNAHIILEEAPATLTTHDTLTAETARQTLFFPLSAKTDTALKTMQQHFAEFVEQHEDLALANAAFTLQVGRNDFECRKGFVASSREQLLAQLRNQQFDGVVQAEQKETDRPVVFMFTGQGAQYAQMGRGLYASEPVFAEAFDACADSLTPLLGQDLRELVLSDSAESDALLQQTQFTQPALFAVEYATATLWMHWGVQPESMIGHSIGEIVAACIAGVFSLEDALRIVAKRGQLMHDMPTGAMLSLSVSAAHAERYVNNQNLWLAASNSESLCVLSGTHEAIEQIQQTLLADGISYKLLRTSHAFHSGMMEGALDGFRNTLAQVEFGDIETPFVSNVSGDWATNEQVSTPEYWLSHLRQAVCFAEGLATLADDSERFLLEVGPGQSLIQLAKQHPQTSNFRMAYSLPTPKSTENCAVQMTQALANLWLAGVKPDWSQYYEELQPQRVSLPTYPFERQRYWIEEVRGGQLQQEPIQQLLDTADIQESARFDECQINVKLSVDADKLADEEAQRLQQNMVELRAQIKQLCHNYFSGADADISVTPVGLYSQSASDDASVALMESLTDRPNITTPYVEAETDIQKELTAHWVEVLGIRKIGLHDNFFDIGGNSLIAAALVTKLRTQFDFEVPLAELLELPTIAQLCDLIETKLWLAQTAAEQSDNPQADEEALSLDDAEEFEEGSL